MWSTGVQNFYDKIRRDNNMNKLTIPQRPNDVH